MVLVEHSNLRSRVNDTTFHSFRSSACACKKCRGWSQKNTNAWFFSHHSHERRRSLFSHSLSRLGGFLRKQSASDDSIVVAPESKRERGKISNERRLSTTTTTTTNKRTFFILDLRFHVIDGIRRLHFQGDGFAR